MLPGLMLPAAIGGVEVCVWGIASETGSVALVFFDRRDAWLRGDTS